MVSEVGGIHARPVAFDRLTQTGPSAGAQTPHGVGQSRDAISGQTIESPQQISALAKMAGRSIAQNEAASMVRYADKAMAGADRLLGQMKESLGAIVKMYPPYPIDNPQRIEYLNKYTQLRHQIDALTLPPDNQRLGKLVADPAQLPGAGDMEIPLLGDNKDAAVISAKPMYAGEGGLDLPELPGDSSDEEVAAAAQRVDAAQYYVSGQRAKMAEELDQYIGRINEDLANDQSMTGRQLLADAQGYAVVPDTGRLDAL